MRRALIVGIAALHWLVFASPALGGWQGHATEALGLVSDAVPDAEFVFVIDGAAAQRASPAGQSLTAMLKEFGVGDAGDDLTDAVSGFADAVGVEQGQAFDMLLGRRLIVAGSGPWLGGQGGWAAASVMPRKLALRVLKELRAKGRDVESGQTVFALEDGAYRAALIRPRGPRGNPDDLRLVIFGPKDSSELINTLIRSLSTQASWDVLVGRGNETPAAIAGRMQEINGDISFGVAHVDTGWRGQATIHGFAGLPATAGWSSDLFARLSQGHWFAKTGVVSLDELLASPATWLLPFDREPFIRIKPWLTGRVYLGIQPVGEGLSFEVALEVTDTEKAAADFDWAMHRLVGFLSGRPKDDGPGFGGFLPNSVRHVRIGGALADEMALFGDQAAATWFMTAGRGPGWWVMRLGEDERDQSGDLTGDHAGTIRAIGSLLPGVDVGGPLQSAAELHPGPLGAAFERAAQMPHSFLRPVKHIESIRWTTRPGEQSELEITFEVRMSVDGG